MTSSLDFNQNLLHHDFRSKQYFLGDCSRNILLIKNKVKRINLENSHKCCKIRMVLLSMKKKHISA